MTPVHLQQWIQHPEALDRDTLYELRTLVARYPYFQSLRLLYLKNLYVLHDINFGAELRKAVLYVSDRRVLFYLIEGDRYLLQPHATFPTEGAELEKEPSIDRTLSLIDAFLSTIPEEHSLVTELDYTMDYTSYLTQDAEETTEADAASAASVEVPKLRGQELIDGFIRQSETEEGISLKFSKEDKPVRNLQDEETVDEETADEEEAHVIESKKTASDELDDGCFTETLAKIYIKQHRYDKALEIIKKIKLELSKKTLTLQTKSDF